MIAAPGKVVINSKRSPFDRRVFALDSRASRLIFGAAGFQIITVFAQVFQAQAFGVMVARAVLGSAGLGGLSKLLFLFSVASFAISAVGFSQDRYLMSVSGKIKSRLRGSLLERATLRGSSKVGTGVSTEVMLLATKGVSDIENYLIRFVPAAINAFVAPFIVIIYSIYKNPWAGVAELGTLLAIPPLMVTLGKTASSRAREKWNSLQRLSAQFIESVSAIPTLKGISALDEQEALIESASKQLEKDTMSTLYLAFLSSGALEVVSAIAIALVAVVIGVGLIDGSTSLSQSMGVLILSPVVFAAVRSASLQFHTTSDARVAMDRIFEELTDSSRLALDRTPRGTVSEAAGDLAIEGLCLVRGEVSLIDGLDLTVRPGERVCIMGPSGSGKSTLLRCLAGLESPASGAVLLQGKSAARLSGPQLSSVVSYLPQNPSYFEATLLENILCGRPHPGDSRLSEVLEVTELSELVRRLPGGLNYRIPQLGRSLSAGQMQRIALARALLLQRPILILDEPTSFLDQATELRVWLGIGEFVSDGIMVYATHHSALASDSDTVIEIGAERRLAKYSGGSDNGS